ncbi:hypothetical protein DVH24_013340 [Malus domestica]|uniref:J domain-containing protein n=1 Tax=Malus domestica TaxID=3750 RepID=A0A498HJU4_MALDO|nr:hypothetical protein DVH24_013340 [Malus domestica]
MLAMLCLLSTEGQGIAKQALRMGRSREFKEFPCLVRIEVGSKSPKGEFKISPSFSTSQFNDANSRAFPSLSIDFLGKPMTLSDHKGFENFDFYSPGYGGYRAFHPKIRQLAESNPNAIFLKVNYEEHKTMCHALNIHVLPFFRFYRGTDGRVCSFSYTNATVSISCNLLKDNKARRKKMVNDKRGMVSCVASSSVMDPYRTLKIQPGASESEVRKAFRQLALKYQPDVCIGNNCRVQFHQINEAYDPTQKTHCFAEMRVSKVPILASLAALLSLSVFFLLRTPPPSSLAPSSSCSRSPPRDEWAVLVERVFQKKRK